MRFSFSKIALFIIIMHLLLFGCSKPSQPNTSVFKGVPQNIQDMIVFQKGSYWIYKDSTTGALDSINITNVSWGGDDLHSEVVVNMNRAIDTTTIDLIADPFNKQADNQSGKGFNVLFVQYFPSVNGSIKGFIMTFLHSPFTDTTTYILFDTSKNINQYNNYKVNGIFYKNVVKRKYWYAMEDSKYQRAYYYFVPHIGVIRKEFLGSHRIWNLIRYHVF